MTITEVEPVALYDTPWCALLAAARAAGANIVATGVRPHPNNNYTRGRGGSGMWVSERDLAERMADGLRLTGYDVVLCRGYSTGVVILDAP